jgi:integrase
LQSDNGSEFLGKCINYVKEVFKTINIIKGRPRQPNEQGSVERGNADFKKALLKWEQEYPDKKWPLVGIYVVNKKIITRPAQNKANRSAYEVYYRKVASATTGYILSSDLLQLAMIECAISSVQDLMDVVQLKVPNVLITLEEIHALIRDADSVYEKRRNCGSMQCGQRTLMNLISLKWISICKS